MKTIKKFEQAVIDTESGRGSKYNETFINRYERSIVGEEEQRGSRIFRKCGKTSIPRSCG